MAPWAQEAVLRFRNARRDLEGDRVNAALDEATQAYAAFQLARDEEGMAECVRIVAHGLSRQGLRHEAIKMATEELDKFRMSKSRRAEAIMLLALAEAQVQSDSIELREEAVQLAGQARSASSALKDRKLEGESLLALGNAILMLGGTRHSQSQAAVEAFTRALDLFQLTRSLQLQGRAYHGMAVGFAAGGQVEQALQEAQNALRLFQQAQSVHDEVAELDAIAGWMLEAGSVQKALQFSQQSLGLAKEDKCSLRREALSLKTFIRVNMQLGKAANVAVNALEAVARFRQANAREAESIALSSAVQALAVQDNPERTLQVATEACLVLRELGQRQQETQMLCTMAQVCLQSQQADQAATHAEAALDIARNCGDRASRTQALGFLAQAHLQRRAGGLDKALGVIKEEQQHCRDTSDKEGEAACLLSAASLHVESARHKEALLAAEEARTLFKSSSDKQGEVAALQIIADVHARAMRYEKVLEAAEKALSIAESIGDAQGEASLQIMIAQASMGLLETGSDDPSSSSFKQSASRAAQAAKRAIALARRGNRQDLLASALCALSQAQLLAGDSEAARQAASSAATVSRSAGDRLGEATALVVSANALLVGGKLDLAKQAASKSLLLFQELRDYIGEGMAKAAIDAIENPAPPNQGTAVGKVRVMVRRQKTSADPEVFREKVRRVVTEIVGMDGIMDDTPLMQSGLTSQSSVLLRNALSKEAPGASLPFTLMFDYPSISDLSAFLVETAGGAGDGEEVEEWIEVDGTAAGQVAHGPAQGLVPSGPSPDEIRSQVKLVVAEIVGMDDLVDDTPLMQAGLTSQSAVLLRNALSKQLPGASLPFTMMFDYPSISALTDFFVERTPQVAAGPLPIEAPALISQPQSSALKEVDPEAIRRQVRKTVEDIVGMDDFSDDAALMQHGVTSHNAVLLRDALSREFKGPSMPHTMIFDYPSVLDLTDYFVERSQKS
eukprot:gb/GFBE01035167.1/.p1 GENE.gb/GFBE01035167.1/~~gb/GFBE01035167.1/.p1  ORF type:complete len:963 (+),score=230.90 gb/GFBE01035167.1/:1-2889(+)